MVYVGVDAVVNGVADFVGHVAVYVVVNVFVYGDVAVAVNYVVDGVAYVGVWMLQM